MLNRGLDLFHMAELRLFEPAGCLHMLLLIAQKAFQSGRGRCLTVFMKKNNHCGTHLVEYHKKCLLIS